MDLLAFAETECKESISGCWRGGWMNALGFLEVAHLQPSRYFAAVAAASCFVNWEDLGWTTS